MSLRLDWCSHAAAKYAVEKWHYSESLPTPPIVKIGVWEDGRFSGCVLFSRGASNNLGKPYGLETTAVCELTRVALNQHRAAVSKIVAIAIRLLRRHAPGLRLVVSYADPNQGHIGTIYQAGGWIYTGKTSADFKAIDRAGREWHSRQVSSSGLKRQYGNLRRVPRISECEIVPLLGKHRYLMALDGEMRRRIAPLARPYPKRAESRDSAAPRVHRGEGGASPTSALHESSSLCPADQARAASPRS